MTGKNFFTVGMALPLILALSGPAVHAQNRRLPVPAAPGGERSAVNEASAAGQDSAKLTGVRLLSAPTYTRITLDLSQTARYEVHRVPEDLKRNLPHRIYVDLVGARLAMDSLEPTLVQDGLVRQVRVGQNSDTVVRVVLDVEGLREHKSYIMADPYRLVIDVQGMSPRVAASAGAPSEKNQAPAPVVETAKPAPITAEKSKAVFPAAPEKNKLQPAPPVTAARTAKPGLRKVVLDPGHGGRDPGAIGVDGVSEKDIVLRVAKKLAAKLQKDMGIQVVLTRQDDVYVALENRTEIANAEDADLFISLHMNAAPTGDAKGLETYYLDNTSDEASMRLASRENATARAKVSDLQFILSDMTQNSKLDDSITLAHNLHASVVGAMSKKIADVRDLGVKKALFYVLVGARMPSVLVELFFITNKIEGRAMAQEAYQDTVADALYDGILKYNHSMLADKTL